LSSHSRRLQGWRKISGLDKISIIVCGTTSAAVSFAAVLWSAQRPAFADSQRFSKKVNGWSIESMGRVNRKSSWRGSRGTPPPRYYASRYLKRSLPATIVS
jgi:hypothetical protein